MNRVPLVLLGVGPGDPALLTLRGAKVLAASRVVFAPASPKNDHSVALAIAEPHLPPQAKIVRLDFPMTRDKDLLAATWEANGRIILEHLAAAAKIPGGDGQDASEDPGPGVMLCLGDPLTYATSGYVLQTLLALAPELAVEVVPGISSIQAAAALAGHVLVQGDEELVVLSGVEEPAVLEAKLAAASNAVILKAYKSWPAIRAMLEKLPGTAVLVSEVGRSGERVVRSLIEAPETPPYLSLVLYARPRPGILTKS